MVNRSWQSSEDSRPLNNCFSSVIVSVVEGSRWRKISSLDSREQPSKMLFNSLKKQFVFFETACSGQFFDPFKNRFFLFKWKQDEKNVNWGDAKFSREKG